MKTTRTEKSTVHILHDHESIIYYTEALGDV